MFRWLRGFIIIKINGSNERFLNLCKNKGIVVWDIVPGLKNDYKIWTLKIYMRDYLICKKLAEKSHTDICVVKETGFFALIYNYRNRYVFICSIIFSLLFIWYISLHIWEIRVKDNSIYTSDQIETCLKENNIYTWMLKGDVDCTEIENILRNKFNRISWASAVIKGSILNITITENKGVLNVSAKNESPSDIVADKSGVVESIVVRRGTGKVKKGYKVKKGQVLIAGCVSRKNDSDEITGYQFVPADGDVNILTSYSYKDSFNPLFKVKKYTDKGSSYILQAGSFKICIKSPVFIINDIKNNNNKNKDYAGIGFFNGNIPGINKKFIFYRLEKRYYKINEQVISKSDSVKILKSHLNDFIKKQEKYGTVVVENKVRIYYDAFVCSAFGDIVLSVPQKEHSKIDYGAYKIDDKSE